MLRDVNTTITDGGLGASSVKGEGVHFKIGVSPVISDAPIIITGNMNADKIREKLGLSPLADASMDSVENGSNLIYCIPVTASVDGTVGEIEKQVTGGGNCAVAGKPNNAYDIIVKFTGAGGFNAAVLKYSVDGGYSYSDEITLPLAGALVIPLTGLTFNFTEDAVDKPNSFKVDDTYRVKTTAPQMNNQNVIDALAKLRNTSTSFEFVHIVGESTKALWAAVSAEIVTLRETYKKPLFAILEARGMLSTETIDTYIQYLLDEQKDLRNYDVQIVASKSLYIRMDGVTQEINNAGIVCGLYSKAKVQQSIGETKSFSISGKMLSLLPVGMEDFVGILDEVQYLTFRRYEGLSGYYVTNARMMAPEGSDYRYAEDVRVKNKIMRETRKEALMQLQSDVDMADVQGSLETIAKFIETPLDDMVRAKEISSARIEVPEGQDILTTETLSVIIRFVPVGHVREIDIDLGMENPFRAQ